MRCVGKGTLLVPRHDRDVATEVIEVVVNGRYDERAVRPLAEECEPDALKS